ncbi:MAG: adenylate kinase, partial [Atribacterota bacterium]|nr:adenylate kinase [Atribacterota bacterium]
LERLSSRRVCTKCGAIYNLNYDPPQVEGTCDICGGKLIQRDDDKEETILQRLEVFNNETLPLVGYYQKRHLLTRVNSNTELEERLKVVKDTLSNLGISRKK